MTSPTPEFTREELDSMKPDQLRNQLEPLQEQCRAIQSDSSDGPSIQTLLSAILGRLLSTDTSVEIKSRCVNTRSIASRMVDFREQVKRGSFEYNDYRQLVQLIIEGVYNDKIWGAVLDLDQKLSSSRPATPPLYNGTVFQDTPITHSSASQRDREEHRDRLENRLFEEIKSTAYRGVGGFFEKFFGEPIWRDRAEDIFNSMQDLYVEEKWANLPDAPSQDDFYGWVQELQKKFLSRERGRFSTTKSPRDLGGCKFSRQVDLLVTWSEETQRETYNWKDIKIVREHKTSKRSVKEPLVQLAIYVREIFAAQPTRRFVHAFTICGRHLETWVFDRSGCYSSGPFDIHSEPLKFIQVLTAYTMMDEEQLGLDVFKRQSDKDTFINVEDVLSGNKLELQLKSKPLFCQRAIVCRGTTCYLTRASDTEEWGWVTKFSWTSDKRDPEADLLQLAKTRGVEGIAQLVGHCLITKIDDIRSNLVFEKLYPFHSSNSQTKSLPSSSRSRSVLDTIHQSYDSETRSSRKRERVAASSGSPKRFRSSNNSNLSSPEVAYSLEEPQMVSLLAPPSGPYDNRLLRCLVISPAGRPIHEYKNVLELLSAMRDAIKGHRSLFQKGHILHRDVSENNIIITAETSGFAGILIDMDLAKDLKKENDGDRRSGARCRTGTMEFMAIDVLRGKGHTYRHDLESFYYVLIWQCGYHGWRHSQSKKLQNNNPLHGWYKGSYSDIATVKHGIADSTSLDHFLKEVFPPEFESLKPLCQQLRTALFPIDTATNDRFVTGAYKDENPMYDEILKAFDEAIEKNRSQGDSAV